MHACACGIAVARDGGRWMWGEGPQPGPLPECAWTTSPPGMCACFLGLPCWYGGLRLLVWRKAQVWNGGYGGKHLEWKASDLCFSLALPCVWPWVSHCASLGLSFHLRKSKRVELHEL